MAVRQVITDAKDDDPYSIRPFECSIKKGYVAKFKEFGWHKLIRMGGAFIWCCILGTDNHVYDSLDFLESLDNAIKQGAKVFEFETRGDLIALWEQS